MDRTQRVKPRRQRPTAQTIRRAVASSTAIETGRSVAEIERRLQAKSGRFRDIELAKP